MLATGSQTIQYFAPALVEQLGYTSYSKQYMSKQLRAIKLLMDHWSSPSSLAIPIYAVAAVFILAFCFGSDFAKERGHFLCGAAAFGCLSFIITVAVDDQKVKCELPNVRLHCVSLIGCRVCFQMLSCALLSVVSMRPVR